MVAQTARWRPHPENDSIDAPPVAGAIDTRLVFDEMNACVRQVSVGGRGEACLSRPRER
jgi:hypothetical protein